MGDRRIALHTKEGTEMRVFGFILILILIVMGMYNGGGVMPFLDPGAILIVLGTAIGGFLMSAGPRTGTALGSAFSKAASEDDLRDGIRAFRMGQLGALTGGFFAMGVGTLMVLSNFDDAGAMGPGMALMVLGLFWAVFAAYFVLRPLQVGIERRLMAADETAEISSETALDLLVFGGGILSCAVVLGVLTMALGK